MLRGHSKSSENHLSGIIPDDEDVPADLVRLWICRAVLGSAFSALIGGGLKEVDARNSDIAEVRNLLGLPSSLPESIDEVNIERKQLMALRKQLEKKASLEEGTMFRNLAMLGKRIGFSILDQRIIALRASFRLSSPLYALLNGVMSNWSVMSLHRTLADMLAVPVRQIAEALSTDSLLQTSGILIVNAGVQKLFSEKSGVYYGLIDTLIKPHRSIGAMLTCMVPLAKSSTLTIGDFPHLKSEVDLAIRFLRALSRTQNRGSNILLYGQPGTGKTELVGAIANALNWSLYDVCSIKRSEVEVTSVDRMHRLKVAQHFFQRSRKSAVLFDEIDNAISEQGSLETKHLIISIMEETRVPTFWVTNHPKKLDEAFKRRFDLVIAVDNPPQSVKTRILEKACRGIKVDAEWVQQQAAVQHITPALITRIAGVSRLSSGKDGAYFSASFNLLRDQHLKVQGKSVPDSNTKLTMAYDISTVNASLNVGDMVGSLSAAGEARCLFHGMPGSGKTAFAHEMARMIDRPIHQVIGSDLASPLVGVTEQNIAKAFKRAADDGAVLLIDEADSFLQSREQARYSWEVTAVNELLQQLERFHGVLVCTTNSIDALDPAAMRRFDAKVEFSALRKEQSMRLYESLCTLLGIALDSEALAQADQRLARLDTITPGDFATVARLMRLSPSRNHSSGVLQALADEQRYKGKTNGRAIGFLN